MAISILNLENVPGYNLIPVFSLPKGCDDLDHMPSPRLLLLKVQVKVVDLSLQEEMGEEV